MEEAMVTVDGVRYPAGRPFMVIATQNPVEQAGTYKLPEAQLDRFLMKTSVGYPSRDAARKVLAESAQPDRSKKLSPVISQQAIAEMCDLVRDNHVDDGILDYVQDLADATRNDPDTSMGVSTRGAIAMVRACRVWAAAHGRNFVIPDDVKELVVPVWTHRIIMSPTATFGGSSAEKVITRVLGTVPSPASQAG
jgi:MoxR-like ATPases